MLKKSHILIIFWYNIITHFFPYLFYNGQIKKIIFLLQCQQSAIHSKYFDSLRGKKIYFWKLHSGILGLTMSFS